MNIYRLKNTVQHYAWGDTNAIPALLECENTEQQPWAELWMGAHSKAPSRLPEMSDLPLDKIISENPVRVLGRRVSDQFSDRLPFLFKILAAGKPLSIQAHPTLSQARAGFDAENTAGIPIDAPHRNYRDNNHKPEIICAISEFWALRGFRRVEEIKSFFSCIEHPVAAEIITILSKKPEHESLADLVRILLELPDNSRDSLLNSIDKIIRAQKERLEPEWEWVNYLRNQYPHDIGSLSPLFLNLFHLQPEESLYLDAGVLHAYLKGTGIELMANSDNVLRGGLTVKYIDIKELMHVLNFESESPQILHPEKKENGTQEYTTPAPEFSLQRVQLQPNASLKRSRNDVEIHFCLNGHGCYIDRERNEELHFKQGDSHIVFAEGSDYLLSGEGIIYIAGVPNQ